MSLFIIVPLDSCSRQYLNFAYYWDKDTAVAAVTNFQSADKISVLWSCFHLHCHQPSIKLYILDISNDNSVSICVLVLLVSNVIYKRSRRYPWLPEQNSTEWYYWAWRRILVWSFVEVFKHISVNALVHISTVGNTKVTPCWPTILHSVSNFECR